MRKSIYALVAILAIPFAFTGCGDDSTSSNNAPQTLTAQDKQTLASLGSIVLNNKQLVDGYSTMAKDIAKSFASGFAPTAERKLTSGCSAFDTSFAEDGMQMTMKITKVNGTAFASCEEASAAITTDGLGMKISMTMVQQDINMSMNFDMTYRMVGTDGYDIGMTMKMSMTGSVNGQNIAVSIDPMALSIQAASSTSTPTMNGSLTMTSNGFTIVGLAFNESGVKPQTVDILKNGSKVATLVIDANGNSVAYDTNGNAITA